MNGYRLAGDLSHLLAIIILLLKIWKTRSCAGISGRSQILFALVYTTRYLDLFSNFISRYNSVMKVVFIGASYATLYLMYKFKATYDRNHDTFHIEFLVIPVVILALVVNHDFSPLEVLWTFSIYLESVAILPQLFLVSKTGKPETIISYYLFCLGSYRSLYILNWVYRYYSEGFYDLIAIIAGVVQIVPYCYFFYLYITKDAFENYFKAASFTGTDNPCGFAAYEIDDCGQTTINSEVLHSSPLFRNLESRHSLCVAFFCLFKKSSDWFNYWARYCYRWWRKFSSIPSKFSMSDVIETERNDQQISLLMEFPWGQEHLETITMYNENFFRDSCHALSPLKPMKDFNLAVIVCESELNLASFAYLTNSFAEKWRDGQTRLLQLHTKLAPYKVCMCIRRDCLNDSKHLRDIAKHLEKGLKKYRVAVYPYWNSFMMDETSQFSRSDEMGIPYIIVLDNKALYTGIAH